MTLLDGPRKPAASGTADSLVIFLHGYGADGNDLIGLSQPLASILPNTEFVSPNAPEPCAMSPSGRQWFPITYIDGSSMEEMMAGYGRAQEALNAFIDAEIARTGFEPSRIALVGFSQGTMMSLSVGPRREAALAGIVGFSGRLIEPEKLAAEIRSKPPVLLIHGDADEVVPPSSLKEAADALVALEVPVSAAMRPGLGHGIDERGLVAAAQFLMTCLGVAQPEAPEE